MRAMTHRRTAVTALVGLAVLATPAWAGTKSVKVGDNWFVRDTDGVPKITVAKGTRVKFSFIGDSPHNIIGKLGSTKKFESPVKQSGTYSVKLKTAGTYKLFCDIHGAKDQSMKIVVK